MTGFNRVHYRPNVTGSVMLLFAHTWQVLQLPSAVHLHSSCVRVFPAHDGHGHAALRREASPERSLVQHAVAD